MTKGARYAVFHRRHRQRQKGDADQVVDVFFPLSGYHLPIDHGYALYSAISRCVPEIHRTQNLWGVHTASKGQIERTDDGWFFRVTPTARIGVRLPASCLGYVMCLAKRTLEIDSYTIRLGDAIVTGLEPARQLQSAFVTFGSRMPNDETFEEIVRTRITGIPGLHQLTDGLTIKLGRRRLRRVKKHLAPGFSVVVGRLTPHASLLIQEYGIGGRRHFGAGLFLPRTNDNGSHPRCLAQPALVIG